MIKLKSFACNGHVTKAVQIASLSQVTETGNKAEYTYNPDTQLIDVIVFNSLQEPNEGDWLVREDFGEGMFKLVPKEMFALKYTPVE